MNELLHVTLNDFVSKCTGYFCLSFEFDPCRNPVGQSHSAVTGCGVCECITVAKNAILEKQESGEKGETRAKRSSEYMVNVWKVISASRAYERWLGRFQSVH